jgi:hypothetical protein
MKTLSEIEEVMAMRGSAIHWDAQKIRYNGMLLVRAVKELGAMAQVLDTAVDYAWRDEVSSDVLALLEEE